MKRLVFLCVCMLSLFVLAGCAADKSSDINEKEYTAQAGKAAPQNGKVLIAYFSMIDDVPKDADAVTHATSSIGNTKTAAEEIQRQTGGDLFAIKTANVYPSDHKEASAIAKEEIDSDARPELISHVDNMAEYDTVYIGFPIWWYVEPMAVRSFLEEYDFSGKKVIPFCTSMGADIKSSEEDITSLVKGAKVLPGITLHAGQKDQSEAISEWLSDIGMK